MTLTMQEFASKLGELLTYGEIAEARSLVESWAQRDAARYQLGLAALALHELDVARFLRHAARAHELAATDPTALQYLALAHLRSGNQAEAERLAREAAARDETTRSLGALGNILLESGKPAEAGEAYLAVLEREPTNKQALLGMAAVAYCRDDVVAAMTALTGAFHADAEDPATIASAMNLLRDGERPLEQLAALDDLPSSDLAEDVRVFINLVKLQLTVQMSEAALAADAQRQAPAIVGALVRQARGQSTGTRIAIARALTAVGMSEEIRAIVEGVEREEMSVRERSSVLFLRGILAERAGDEEKAIDCYSEAVRLDGTRFEAACNATSLMLARGDATALDKMARLLDLVPPTAKRRVPSLLFNEALYFEKTNRREAARANLEHVLAATKRQGELGRMAEQVLASLDEG